MIEWLSVCVHVYVYVGGWADIKEIFLPVLVILTDTSMNI